MSSRFYAIAVIALGACLFVLVLLANILLDSESVLGTGVIADPLNQNDRYLRFVDYEAAADRYDGLLFGSSRARAIPRAELSHRMGADFANFAVSFGMISDHVPVLKYVMRTKEDSGRRLRAVFLLLDVDTFGTRTVTGRNIQTLLPPALTGETAARFRWRYLTAIQFRAWSGEISRAFGRRQAATEATGRVLRALQSPIAAFAAEPDPNPAPPPLSMPVTEALTETPIEMARQLEMLAELATLCRDHGVRLIAVAPPMHRRNVALYAPDELIRRREKIAAVVPLWDFDSPDWLSDRRDLWTDTSHFTESVAVMMLDVIFADRKGPSSAPFGHLYGN